MELCSKNHPLCGAVSWNWDLNDGFANCYPKTFDPDAYKSVRSRLASTHSAIGLFKNGTDTCPANSTYTSGSTNSQNQNTFDLTCNEQRAGNNLTTRHAANLHGCMDSCVTYDNSSTKPCVGVVYDTYMTDGYENCYLKSADGIPAPGNTAFTFASLRAATTPPPSKSKAWIAGPVIGAIAAIALVSLLIFWLMRRRRKNNVHTELPTNPGRGSGEHFIAEKRAGGVEMDTIHPHELDGGSQGKLSEANTQSTHFTYELPGSAPARSEVA